MELIIDDSRISYQISTWDKVALNKNSIEILGVEYRSLNQLDYALKSFEEFCILHEYKYTNIRIRSSQSELKVALQENGYLFIESSIELTQTKMRLLRSSSPLLNKIELRKANIADLPSLKEIASTEFHFGRIAEDPKIKFEINQIRNQNWIDSLYEKNSIVCLINKGKIYGFMAYDIKCDVCQLILGGTSSKFNHFAIAFWQSFFDEILLEHPEVSIFETMVSTANIGILNLYTHFGFRVKNTFWGFSKHRL